MLRPHLQTLTGGRLAVKAMAPGAAAVMMPRWVGSRPQFA